MVLDGFPDGKGLSVGVLGLGELAQSEVHDTKTVKREGEGGGGDGPGVLVKHPFESFLPFDKLPSGVPVTPEGASEAEGVLNGRFLLGGEGEGVPEVIVFEDEGAHPARLFDTENASGGPFGKERAPVAMLGPDCFLLSRLNEFFRGEVADHFYHSIALGIVLIFEANERLIDEGGEEIGNGLIFRQGLRGGKRPTASKDRESGEEVLFLGSQGVVGPIEGGLEGLLPDNDGFAGGGEEGEIGLEPLGNFFQGHGANTGGGELDGERNAFEIGADLGDDGDVGGVNGEVRASGLGAFDEELDAFIGENHPAEGG